MHAPAWLGVCPARRFKEDRLAALRRTMMEPPHLVPSSLQVMQPTLYRFTSLKLALTFGPGHSRKGPMTATLASLDRSHATITQCNWPRSPVPVRSRHAVSNKTWRSILSVPCLTAIANTYCGHRCRFCMDCGRLGFIFFCLKRLSTTTSIKLRPALCSPLPPVQLVSCIYIATCAQLLPSSDIPSTQS
jgi:hypothetical protein